MTFRLGLNGGPGWWRGRVLAFYSPTQLLYRWVPVLKTCTCPKSVQRDRLGNGKSEIDRTC